MIIHNFEQGTPEWFEVRLGKFTASTAQAIASNGKGLETLVFEKAAEIITGKAKANYTNDDIDRGHELEMMARNAYELETGMQVKEIGFVEESQYIGCSPDGEVDKDGLVEIKCKNDANFARYMYEGKIDPEHNWQMQMQMFITGKEWVDYVVYNENFPKPVIVKRVMRNETEIAKLKTGLNTAVALLETIVEKIKAYESNN